VVAQLEPPKQTPAGVPKQRIWVEHRSRQTQLGQAREVQARLAVILIGDEIVQRAARLQQGARIRLTGFIARAGFKGEAQDRLELHATQLDSLD
jgi:primosomal replication protein N